MKLYVGNLSYSTTEDTLRTLFSNYADVVSVKIKEDEYTGQSKGFGFIEVEDEIKAQRAIGGMNGKDVDGRRIRVCEAVENPRRRPGTRPGARTDFGGERRFERRGDRDFSRGFDGDSRGRDYRGNSDYSRDSSREYRRYSDSRDRDYRDDRDGRNDRGGRDFGRRESRGYGRDRDSRFENRDGRFENRERRSFSDRRSFGGRSGEARDDEY